MPHMPTTPTTTTWMRINFRKWKLCKIKHCNHQNMEGPTFDSVEPDRCCEKQHFRRSHDHQHIGPVISSLKLGNMNPLDIKSKAKLSSGSSGTPIGSSKSSWVSHTGILSSPCGSVPVHTNKTCTRGLRIGGPRWFRWRSKSLCPCSGKKSVQVEETQRVKTSRMVDMRSITRSLSVKGITLSKENDRRNLAIDQTLQKRNCNSDSKCERFSSLKCSSSVTSTPIFMPSSNCALNSSSERFTSIEFSSNATSTSIFIPSPTCNSDSNSEELSSSKYSSSNQRRKSFSDQNGFTFPMLTNTEASMKPVLDVIPPSAPVPSAEDPLREKLQVLQPFYESIVRNQEPKSRKTSYDEENVSDASSDLFEIESFFIQTNSHHPSSCHPSEPLDGTSDFNIKKSCTDMSSIINESRLSPRESPARVTATSFSFSDSEKGCAGDGGGGRKDLAVGMPEVGQARPDDQASVPLIHIGTLNQYR